MKRFSSSTEKREFVLNQICPSWIPARSSRRHSCAIALAIVLPLPTNVSVLSSLSLFLSSSLSFLLFTHVSVLSSL